MDTQNPPKKSPRNTNQNERSSPNADIQKEAAEHSVRRRCNHDHDPYDDRSFDLVARVRAAKEAAQRRMEEFGDVSEYTVTKIYGRKKESPEERISSSSDSRQEDAKKNAAKAQAHDEEQ